MNPDIRKVVDRSLAVGPASGMLIVGFWAIFKQAHLTLVSVLLGLGFIWAGLAWVVYIAGGKE